jgi:hypothetical protein
MIKISYSYILPENDMSRKKDMASIGRKEQVFFVHWTIRPHIKIKDGGEG